MYPWVELMPLALSPLEALVSATLRRVHFVHQGDAGHCISPPSELGHNAQTMRVRGLPRFFGVPV